MANNYDQATVTPYFPPEVVAKYADKLSDLGVSTTDDGYIYVEEGCWDWDEFHSLLQQMLIEAEMEYCYVEGANTCDKMRQGEFGGFAHFITKDDVLYVNTGSWCNWQEEEFKASKKEGYLTLRRALEIMMELASANIISEQEAEDEPDLEPIRKEQEAAYEKVANFLKQARDF